MSMNPMKIPKKFFSRKNPPQFDKLEAEMAGQLVRPMRTSIPMVKSEIRDLSGNNLCKILLDILCYFEIPHPLGGGGFDVLNPPGAPGWGIFDFETPGVPGVGDLRFGAPHANTICGI